MIGLDTNVLVRYIAQDDARQSAIATEFIHQLDGDNPGFVTQITLIELVWVMQSCYKSSKVEIVNILEKLLRTHELIIENADIAVQALNLFSESKADFADCLIERCAHQAGCSYTVTFDDKASKATGMRQLA